MFPYLVSKFDRGDVVSRKIVWFEKEGMNDEDVPSLESGEEIKFLHEEGLQVFRERFAPKEYSYENNKFVELTMPSPIVNEMERKEEFVK